MDPRTHRQALRDQQYYPAIIPPSSVTLTFLGNRTSASIAPPHQLVLVFDSISPQGAIALVTFDGSDPCSFDSKPNPAARAVALNPSETEYRVPLPALLDGASAYAFRARVRVLDATMQQWSAQATADFASPTQAPLKISAAAQVSECIMITWWLILISIGLAAWNQEMAF